MNNVIEVGVFLYIFVGGPFQIIGILNQCWRCIKRKSSGDLALLTVTQGLVLNLSGICFGIDVNDLRFSILCGLVTLCYTLLLFITIKFKR